MPRCLLHGLCLQGLDAPVLASLTNKNSDSSPLTASVRRLIYVSCGFDALKHDALALANAGWRMVHSEGHVLFPGSDHIETVAIFDR